MDKKIVLPDIGEGIDQVEISEISVKTGDKVSKDDIGLVVETEKASMEIPIPIDGIIKDILVNNQDNISPGDEIFIIEKSNNIALDDNNKPEVEENNPQKEELSEKNDFVKEEIQPAQSKQHSQKEVLITTDKIPTRQISASPSIRRFARELGCDLTLVNGSGRKGRITKNDVQRYIKSRLNQTNIPNSSNNYQYPDIDFTQFGETESLTLNKIKKISGERLQSAWNTIPHVTQFDEIDITNLDNLRKLLNHSKKSTSPKMSYLPFVMKAIVQLLKEFPQFNSSLDRSRSTLILKKYYNIGIAVDTPNGLIVPVIKNVDTKTIPYIAKELSDISARARDKKIKPDELTGGCFTISSLGGISGTAFTPIVNPPEVAILGISKTSWKPVYDGEKFQPRLILPVSLSYDHRVIDGAEAARFTKLLAELLIDIQKIQDLNIY